MKRELLSGNEAVARGAYEAGVTFAAAYPGTPSTEILENIAKYKKDIYCHWGANEKTSMEEALGACFTGARSMAVMKHVGLNVAADPFFSASYIGVKGGLLVISADDPGMHSSQNEQDNRNYALAAKMPVLEPSDSQEAKDMVIDGIKLSEKFNTPVMIRMTTRTCHSRSAVELGERETPPEIEYVKDFHKTMLLPALARAKHVAVEIRQEEIKNFSNTFKHNYIIEGKNRVGVIASGISFQYGREVFEDAWFLKLGMPYPFPSGLLREFAEHVDTIYILEENDPFIETFVRLENTGKEIKGKNVFPKTGELSVDFVRTSLGQKDLTPKFNIHQIPKRPPNLCAGCIHTAAFHHIKTLKLVATGDIGCYTLGALPPLNAMDTCIDMGASITALLGMEKAYEKAGKKFDGVAVIGDSTFLHSGITGLLDVIYSNGKSTVIILDNAITAMTGHQENPGSGRNLMGEIAPKVDIVKLVRDGLGIEHTYVIDAYDVKELKKVLKREVKREAPSVLVVRRPCVLLFKGAKWSPMAVDAGKCTYCKLCLKLGCPAIVTRDEKAHIVPERCIGCTVCAQVCPVDAIEFVDKEGKNIHNTDFETFLKSKSSKSGGKK